MKFKKAMHKPTPEEQKRLDDFLEKMRTERREKILALGFTDEDIEKAIKLKEEVYEGIPNYYDVPDLYQFMKYQYKEELSKRAKQLEEITESINEQIAKLDDKSNISDGSHTFDELYFHRMILFSVICNQNPELAFKAKSHYVGDEWDNYFICGIETKKGWYTYHYQNAYWDYFKVPEVDRAPKWDGHTAGDVTRLLSLEAE